ncbi:Endonuclease/exonuclease/phosphatase, partial [Circinella umbellata]
SLNCNGLIKITGKTNTESDFIHHLKQQNPQLITIQESHAATEQIQSLFNFQFNTKSSIWTQDCGLVSMSPEIQLTTIKTTTNQHAIPAKVTHTSLFFYPIYIIVVYAPATTTTVKYYFYLHFLKDFSSQFSDPLICDNLILAGDFNYDLHKHDHISNSPFNWHSLLSHRFTNCIRDSDPQLHITTFRRGKHIYSLLDYIYAGTALCTCIHSPDLQYLDKNWSDHALLVVEFTL